MTLDDIFQKLSYDYLSELSIAGEGKGRIPFENIPKFTSRVIDGLRSLYARFPLKVGSLVLTTVDGLYVYPLRTEFAQTSGSAELNKYIQDSVSNPFTGDILAVTDIYDSNRYELPLNDRRDLTSWHTTAYDTVAMDYPRTGDFYFIDYRANHPVIPLVPEDPALIEIRLPVALEAALLNHVAGNIYGAMSMEGALTKSQLLLKNYEAECILHEDRNTFNNSKTSAHTKLEDRGWA